MKLSRVIIVDDEEIIREGIQKHIPWEELGYELVGTAGNGMEALKLFLREEIDLLVTDICMPVMDGLELLKNVNESYPLTRSIVLSGHDEFNYAQQCLKLGVKDYVLKPITPRELKHLLRKMKEELEREEQEKNFKESLKKHMEESLPVLREKFLNEWVCQPMEEEKINSKFSTLLMNPLLQPYQVLLLQLDHSNQEEEQLLQFAITEIVKEYFLKYPNMVIFSNFKGQTVLVLTGSSTNVYSDAPLFSLLQEAKELIQKRLNVTVTVGIGNPVHYKKDVHLSFKEATDALEYRFLMGINQIIFIGDLEKRKVSLSIALELEKKLLFTIKMGTIQQTHDLIEAIFSAWGKADVGTCKWYVTELIIMINKTFSELDVDAMELWGDPHQLLNDLHQHKTLYQIKDLLTEICQKANVLINEKRKHSTRALIAQAKMFIENNYGDIDLSLGRVCEELHVSPSYFSLIFKKETQNTFVEFLTKVRLEKAKKLLKTSDLKNYEIAEKIGFTDPQYFSTVFKKHVGVTPTEYRSSLDHSTLPGRIG